MRLTFARVSIENAMQQRALATWACAHADCQQIKESTPREGGLVITRKGLIYH